MITPATSSPAGAAGAFGTNPFAGALGKDDFLRMLVTQLKNQDPLNPMQGTEFATQLAQFTSLEQLVQVNGGLDELRAQQAGTSLALEAGLGASMIGKNIIAVGNQVAVGADGTVAVPVELPAMAGHVSVRLLDAHGQEIAKHEFANVGQGKQTLRWDAGVAAGAYHVEVTAEAPGGATVPVTTYVHASVDGVFFNQGHVFLRAGDLVIALDSLVEVR